MRYFAYGSNLFSAWLRSRTPSATVLGPASLDGHALRWHKRSRDGSGKCDAQHTGAQGDRVHGVVFEIATSEKHLLDRAEPGYAEARITVELRTERLEAFTYRAQPESIDASLVPYAWYRALVLAGAREHGLPGAYLAGLRSQLSVSDEDGGRTLRAWELLVRDRQR